MRLKIRENIQIQHPPLTARSFLTILDMSRHRRTKPVPPKTTAENQTLEALEEISLPLEQKDEQSRIELDQEIECPLCNDIMELNFDSLAYFCESCSFY